MQTSLSLSFLMHHRQPIRQRQNAIHTTHSKLSPPVQLFLPSCSAALPSVAAAPCFATILIHPSASSTHARNASSSSPIKSVPNSSRPPANFTATLNSMTPSPDSGHSWPTTASLENAPPLSPTSVP